MGAASREFLMMREDEQTRQLYVPIISKKEVVKKAEEDVKRILDAGEVDIAEAFIDANRLNEYLTTFTKELKKHVTEEEYGKSYDVKGANISFRGTGDRLDYEQDEVYAELKEKLKDRENLIKTAYKAKEMIFDADGVEVPKVGIKTHSSQSVVIKF